MPQIWTQGETQANSVWFPTIDSPNAKTSQEIYITVEDQYVTLSNGDLISSKKNKDGTRTDYWKQDLPHAPYLFMMAVGEFSIVKDSYTKKDGSKIEVNYYVEPEYEKDAKGIFGETPNMIGYFSELLDLEYPWDKYNQVVVRDYVSGAMENTGAVIFGEFVYKDAEALLDEMTSRLLHTSYSIIGLEIWLLVNLGPICRLTNLLPIILNIYGMNIDMVWMKPIIRLSLRPTDIISLPLIRDIMI